MKLLRSDRVGFLVIIVSLIALGQLLYTTYEQRQTAECQARVNIVFLDTLKQRASINDADREATRVLVGDVSDALGDRDRQREAFAKYDSTNAQLDALRASFKYPEVDGVC